MNDKNELHLIFINRQKEVERDKLYRILVTLIRSDRPRYWNFLCNNCGSKIVELQNMELISEDDFYDPQNINNYGIGRRCKGTLPSGLPCQNIYFFHLQ